MSNWEITEDQLHDINVFLQASDDSLVANCITRTAQESKLFPIMPYLMVNFFDAYYRYPDHIRRASEIVSPEEAGHRARNSTCKLSGLPAWAVPNFYINGRNELIRLGLLRPEDNLEDLWTVVDWYKRFASTLYRNSGHIYTYQAHDIRQVHDERVLQVFEADAYEADERLRAAAANFVAMGTQYAFLSHCESRVGLSTAGPYNLGGSRLMHVRDFMNLSECDFPWLDGIGDKVPYNNLTLAMITKDTAIEITDWASIYTTPESYRDEVLGVGLYTSDFLTDRYLPVAMDSAAELADTLEQLSGVVQTAIRELYRRFSEMKFDEMVEAGSYVYFQALDDLDHMAGLYDQWEWQHIDSRARRLWDLYNEEYSLNAYTTNYALPGGLQGGQPDYYLHPVMYRMWRMQGPTNELPAPARVAHYVPPSALVDHDYPRRVNPNGLAGLEGDSKLPQKTGKYTVTAGRMTQDEINERARAFHSPLLEAPWRYLDGESVKHHWRSDDVDALYRYTQERSRLLKGQGAQLVRSDIDRLRKESGERPWAEVAEGK